MPQTYVFKDFNGKKILRIIYEKQKQKTNQTEFKIRKVMKTDENLCIKWKGFDNLFNSGIVKKECITLN